MSAEQYCWYIVQIFSGSEKRVTEAIRKQAEKKSLLDSFEQIIVPVQEVIEIRRGQKVTAEKKVLPSYILIKMKMNDETWHLVKNIANVKGFLGPNGKPQPVPENEVKRIFKQIEETAGSARHSVNYEIGESVKIIDGPFESFIGVVEEIDEEKSRLKVSVSIFGRSTPVELEYIQITKV
ncbi:MAG: transcription termination/antitermination protein NusG [Alphaproteobacteria bacterium]